MALICDYCNNPIVSNIDGMRFMDLPVPDVGEPTDNLTVDLHVECREPFITNVRAIKGERPKKADRPTK